MKNKKKIKKIFYDKFIIYTLSDKLDEENI